MNIEVHKYGGVSMEPEARVKKNAAEIARIVKDGTSRVIAVVSAGGKDTENLLRSVQSIDPKARLGDAAVDITVSAGEVASVGRLTAALHAEGIKDVLPLMPHQLPMQAVKGERGNSALIRQVDGAKIRNSLGENRVIVAAGFLAVDENGRLHTLGRGGSDLSANAIAASLQQTNREKVPVYFEKEEKGVRAAPPSLVKDANLIRHMTHERCLALVQASSNPFIARRAVEVAAAFGVEMTFRQAPCFLENQQERSFPGTVISGRMSDAVEEESNFRALAAREFVRYDVDEKDVTIVLNAFEERGILYEDLRESKDGGYKVILPRPDNGDRSKLKKSLGGLPLSAPRNIGILRFMDAGILSGENQFTGQIHGLLTKTDTPFSIATEADSIVIETDNKNLKLFAILLADHFALR